MDTLELLYSEKTATSVKGGYAQLGMMENKGVTITTCQNYYVFGMKMPGRNYSSGDYRFGYGGREQDNEIKGDGNSLDFAFRMYDSRLGKFLSVDPLTANYPWNSPYAFAENRCIDGIDLEGLEYLDADVARVEFSSGKLFLKVENYTGPSRRAWNAANNNPKCWKEGEVGLDRTIANLQMKSEVQTIIYNPTPAVITQQKNPMDDQPETPATVNGQNDGIKSAGYNRSAKREIARKGGISNGGMQKVSKGVGKAVAVVEAFKFIYETYNTYAGMYDESKIQEHLDIVKKVLKQTNEAIDQGLIDKKYQNAKDLGDIMNVMLQGVSNSSDPQIFKIGMDIFNNFNPPVSAPAKQAAPADKSEVAPKTEPMFY